MTCNEVLDRLSAFHDGELDPVGSREVERHLDACPGCADALARMMELGERLRAEAPYHRAPDSLRARVSQGVWGHAGGGRITRRHVGSSSQAWLSAAAAVLVVAGGVGIFAMLQNQTGLGSVEREVVSSHVRSLMASHLTDVASTDQHTVKPWFNGKLDFSPPVPDLATSGYPLIGGRLDYLQGHPVAALVYQRRKHWINVFVWPKEKGGDSAERLRTQQGYHVIHEAHGGMTYWIVSDLSTEELSHFAQMLVADR
jgi:anti-sigma factor RsiW